MGTYANFINFFIKYVEIKLSWKSCSMVIYENFNELNILIKNKKLTINCFRDGWKFNAI
jgi:hypothetical protein